MKRILYLTFYFEPDLCAGSFRNSPLAKELGRQFGLENQVTVLTTKPNRYSSFKAEASDQEIIGNVCIKRFEIPEHKSGMVDQVKSFLAYYKAVLKETNGKQYDLVFASSSRLFTAVLGQRIASRIKSPLYLDIRDIFVDTLRDVLDNKVVRSVVLPTLKHFETKTFNYASHINLISGGFAEYFSKFKTKSFSSYPNGIDDLFLSKPKVNYKHDPSKQTITYAGNIGEGQGLHKIIPGAAKKLGNSYQFIVVGDGGAKGKLIDELDRLKVTNVEIRKPVQRDELLSIYHGSSYLFMHLNDYAAFKKVLPSKVFEYGALDKPILAGVGGFAAQFVRKELSNSILFNPGDEDSLVGQLRTFEYKHETRTQFVNKFKRENINKEMAESILNHLK